MNEINYEQNKTGTWYQQNKIGTGYATKMLLHINVRQKYSNKKHCIVYLNSNDNCNQADCIVAEDSHSSYYSL